MVFLKFPDNYIEVHGKYPTFGLSGLGSTYGWCATAQLWLMYFPTLIGVAFLSLGTRAAYCYPYASALEQKVGTEAGKDTTRGMKTKVIYEFLRDVCELQAGGRPNADNGGTEDADVGFFESVLKGKKNIFLLGAGGVPSEEAEAVAGALYDAGIKDPKVLLELVRLDDDRIFDVKGVQLSASLYIVRNCTFLLDDAFKCEAKQDDLDFVPGEGDIKLTHTKHVADRALELYATWLENGKTQHFYCRPMGTEDPLSKIEEIVAKDVVAEVAFGFGLNAGVAGI